jgi:type I restriction enzyme S subunit
MRYKFEGIAINSTAKKKPAEADKDTYLGLEHLDGESLTVTRFGSDVAPIGEKLLMRKGDVLFGKRRAYQKKVAIAPFDGIFSAHGMVLRPKTDVVTERFFPLFIASDYFLDAAIKISVGSLSPTINWSALKELEFNLPTIDEQDSLAEVLWAMIDTKNAYKRLISLTDDLVKSRFVEMFGDPVTDTKGWGLQPLETSINSLRYGTSTPPPYSSEGLAFIRATNIKQGRVIDNEMVFISESDGKNIEKCRLLGGELIMVRSGVNTGDTCIIPQKYAGHFAGYDIIVELNKSKLNGVFLNELINTSYMQRVVKPLTARSAQPHINAEQVKSLPIIEAPLALQNRFATFAEAADKSKFELNRTLDELDAAYKALVRERLG